jgi:hypothetical protein
MDMVSCQALQFPLNGPPSSPILPLLDVLIQLVPGFRVAARTHTPFPLRSNHRAVPAKTQIHHLRHPTVTLRLHLQHLHLQKDQRMTIAAHVVLMATIAMGGCVVMHESVSHKLARTGDARVGLARAGSRICVTRVGVPEYGDARGGVGVARAIRGEVRLDGVVILGLETTSSSVGSIIRW